MKNIFKIITIFTITLFIISCEKELPTDTTLSSYVGFEMNKQLDLKKNQTSTIPVKVVSSDVSNVDRTFPLTVNLTQTTLNSSFYTVPATVTIPAGSKEGIFNVTIIVNNSNLSNGEKIKIEFPQMSGINQGTSYSSTTVAGVTTITPTQRGITLFLYEECLNTRVKLSIKFDNYPEETAWELFNSSNVLLSSGGFAANGTTITGYRVLGYGNGSTFTTYRCLPPGNYTFIIYDKEGDGLFTNAATQGNYALELLYSNIPPFFTGSGNFGSSAMHTFTIN